MDIHTGARYILDKNDVLWEYDDNEAAYHRTSVYSQNYLTLVELQTIYGPLTEMFKGDRIIVDPPLTEGQHVNVDVEHNAIVGGVVKSYNKEKMYYEIIITANRNQVKAKP